MNIDILKEQLFEILNESDLLICDIEADDINNTIRMTTDDGKHFLITLNEIEWQQIIRLEPEPSEEQLVEEYISIHTREDLLNEFDSLNKENPFLFQILCNCMKLYEMELLTSSEY